MNTETTILNKIVEVEKTLSLEDYKTLIKQQMDNYKKTMDEFKETYDDYEELQKMFVFEPLAYFDYCKVHNFKAEYDEEKLTKNI